MAKVSSALARYDKMGGLFISVLTNPTMGGGCADDDSLGPYGRGYVDVGWIFGKISVSR